MAARDFIAIDVETANSDYSSICSVGLVHFRNNEVFRSLEFLVNPRCDFDSINVSVHGIRPIDVEGAPPIEAVMKAIRPVFEDIVIAHHSPFDRVALSRCSEAYSQPLECGWVDTCEVAQRAWPQRSDRGFGLKNLAADFGLQFQHHKAVEDARIAGLILIRAMKETGVGLEKWMSDIQAETPQLTPQPRKRAARSYVAHVKRDGNANGRLAGQVIVFTGNLTIPRAEAARLAANAGCNVRDSVTQSTTILVVGDQDLSLLAGHKKSGKHRKAEQMIADGYPLKILGETDFLILVGG